jgi:integrase
MRVNLYRRHKPNCVGGHPWQSRSSELEERRKTWKRCDCVIHFSATIGGRFGRKATTTTDWDEARSYASALAASGSWDGAVSIAAPPPPESAPPARITIADAVKVFLANREATVAHPTFRKYKTFTKQLQAFADARGYLMLDQFRPADIDIYFTGSKLGPRTKAKMLERLRSFWRFAVNREWVAKSPVSADLKPPTGSTRAANKTPFTDEQLADIIQACDQLEDQKWGNCHGSGVWTGEDLKDFIWLMTYTGLRISDAVLFNIDRLHGNEVFLRAKKNGGEVFAYIEDWLRDRLTARAKRCGRQPFMIGGTKRLDTVIDTWRQRLHKVFELADVGAERATPHRFRHTFARILLEKGVPVAAVAELMGDTEQVVRASYNRWVPERQAALTAILKDAFKDKPKLVGIKGGRR